MKKIHGSIAGIYLFLVFVVYLLTGLSGQNKNEIIITNFLSYFLIADPYLFLFILIHSIFQGPFRFTDIVRFDHASHTTIGPLSIIVILIGLIGVASSLGAMLDVRQAKYILLGLITFLSFAALLNLIMFLLVFMLPDPGLLGHSGSAAIANSIPSVLLAASYWLAYRKISLGANPIPQITSSN